MMNPNRQLTAKERRKVKHLVTSCCANYDPEYGCLPLDSGCYMFGVGFTSSPLCRYFRDAVLPTEPELEAVFQPVPLKTCKQCGRKFAANGRRVYCSDTCAAEARRKQTATKVRKHREKKKQAM